MSSTSQRIFFFFQAEDGIRDTSVTGVQTCALPISFGNGNPQPIFVSSAVEAARPPRVVGERHLELRLRQRNWYQRAIFFDGAAAELPPAPWDVAFRIYTNVYEGETRIDLHVQALRSAASLD